MNHYKLNTIEIIMFISIIIVYSTVLSPIYFLFSELQAIWYGFIITSFLVGLTLIISTLKTWLKYRKINKLEGLPRLQDYAKDISDKMDVSNPNLIIVNSSVPNAYAIDTLPSKPIIVITDSLIKHLSTSEIKSVIAHEMSHIGSYDIFFMTSLSSLINFILFIHNKVRKTLFDNIFSFTLLVIPFIITRINLFVMRSIFFYISRIREFKADKDSAKYTNPESMKSALINLSQNVNKLSREQKRNYVGNDNLSIVPTESIKKRLFRTHPTTDKRVSELEKLNE